MISDKRHIYLIFYIVLALLSSCKSQTHTQHIVDEIYFFTVGNQKYLITGRPSFKALDTSFLERVIIPEGHDVYVLDSGKTEKYRYMLCIDTFNNFILKTTNCNLSLADFGSLEWQNATFYWDVRNDTLFIRGRKNYIPEIENPIRLFSIRQVSLSNPCELSFDSKEVREILKSFIFDNMEVFITPNPVVNDFVFRFETNAGGISGPKGFHLSFYNKDGVLLYEEDVFPFKEYTYEFLRNIPSGSTIFYSIELLDLTKKGQFKKM